MFKTKLNYKIMNGTAKDYQSDVIFSISDPKSSPLPNLELFTKNIKLISHLHLSGYVTGNSLLAQIISFIGQLKSAKLLYKHEVTKKIKAITDQITNGPSSAKNIALEKQKSKLEKKLETSDKKHELINSLQQELQKLYEKERTILFDNLEQQYKFKLELSLLIQKIFIQNKKISISPFAGQTCELLQKTIEIIDSYEFPAPNIIENQTQFSHEDQFGFIDNPKQSKYFIVAPNKIGRLTTYNDVLKFYLTINEFYKSNNIPEVDVGILEKAEHKEPKYDYSFNNISKYIKTYKLRSFCALLLIIIYIIYSPVVAPILKSYYYLNLLGFGHTYGLIFYAISVTIPIINLVAAIINHLKRILINITENISKRFFNIDKQLNSNETVSSTFSLSNEQIIYEELSNNAEGQYSQSVYKQKPLGIIWHIPLLYQTVNYISKEYRKYCNWYFSYIQNNPLGFSLYIILRSLSLFIKAFYLPISKQLVNTYIDLDKATNTNSFDHSDSQEDLTFAKNSTSQKIMNGHYLVLKRNINGTYLCYKYISSQRFLIKTMSTEEITTLINHKRKDPCEQNNIFYKLNTKKDIWGKLSDTNSLAGIEQLTIPSSWISGPGFVARIKTTFSLNFITSFFKQFFIDIIKSTLILLPTVILYILINKILLSTLYFLIYIPINLTERSFKAFNHNRFSNFLLRIEQSLTHIYYFIYFKISYWFHRFKLYLDKKNSDEFEIMKTIATLHGQTTPYIHWLNKYKHSKELLIRSREMETFLSQRHETNNHYNQEIHIQEIINKTKELLQTFYTEVDNMYKKYINNNYGPNIEELESRLNVIDQYISLINLYISLKNNFTKSFIGKDYKIDETILRHYIIAILELKSSLFKIEHKHCATKNDLGKIKWLLKQCQQAIIDKTIPLLELLKTFLKDEGICDEVKSKIIKPCINACYAQMAQAFGSRSIKLIKNVYQLNKNRQEKVEPNHNIQYNRGSITTTVI